MDCLFCKVVNKELDATIVYEDQEILGFKDINPQAPIHILFIPKKHINTINELVNSESQLIGNLIIAAKNYANKISVVNDGYRLVLNCNNDGGQTVYHIHLAKK